MIKRTSILGTVETICNRGVIMLPNQTAMEAYDLFEQKSELSEICVVDEKNHFEGIVTRTGMLQTFGGMYGYNLHQKAYLCEIMNAETMIVESDCYIEDVAGWAMKRKSYALYDAVVVLKEKYYLGIVTVKDLLMTAISIQVMRAKEENPLTSLPGNKMVERQINKLIGEEKIYGIIYLDLDNFKAYNDAYGFNNGDRMISALAQAMENSCLKEDFRGHIGGDDFVIVTRTGNAVSIAEKIIKNFKESIKKLYNTTDWERGYIISKNRNGCTEKFPVASVSIAIVTNETEIIKSKDVMSEKIVKAKKLAKQKQGNSIVIF